MTTETAAAASTTEKVEKMDEGGETAAAPAAAADAPKVEKMDAEEAAPPPAGGPAPTADEKPADAAAEGADSAPKAEEPKAKPAEPMKADEKEAPAKSAGDAPVANGTTPAAAAEAEAKAEEGAGAKMETDEKKNSKAPVDEEDLLLRRICGQVEFYFSDSNLPRDNFMLEHLKENNGWLPVEVLMTFNRLKKLTSDPKVLVAGLRRSKNLLQVNDEGTLVRRTTKMSTPEEIKEINARTTAVFGMPPGVPLEQSKLFWGQFGGVKSVRVFNPTQRRRKGDKDKEKKDEGKGRKPIYFVEWDTPELAKEVLSKEDVEYEGHQLRIKEKRPPAEKRTGNKRKREDGGERKNTGPPPFTPGLIAKMGPLPEGVGWFDVKAYFESKGSRVAFVNLQPPKSKDKESATTTPSTEGGAAATAAPEKMDEGGDGATADAASATPAATGEGEKPAEAEAAAAATPSGGGDGAAAAAKAKPPSSPNKKTGGMAWIRLHPNAASEAAGGPAAAIVKQLSEGEPFKAAGKGKDGSDFTIRPVVASEEDQKMIWETLHRRRERAKRGRGRGRGRGRWQRRGGRGRGRGGRNKRSGEQKDESSPAKEAAKMEEG